MLNIGIVGTLDADGFFGVRPTYVDFFGKLGVVSIVTPMTVEQWAVVGKQFHVVVLPGGSDIDTTRYSAVPGMTVSDYDPYLEHFDKNLLATTLAKTLVVGICRGHQSLAVQMGLGYYFHQDLPYHDHSTTWLDLVHKVEIYDPNQWHRKVNSLHHQGVVIPRSEIVEVSKNLGLNFLAVTEYTKDQALVEAFEGDHCLGVQWHPEAINDQLVKKWILLKLSKGWIVQR